MDSGGCSNTNQNDNLLNLYQNDLEFNIKSEECTVDIEENDNFNILGKLNKLTENINNIDKRTNDIIETMKQSGTQRLSYDEIRNNHQASQNQVIPNISSLSKIDWENIEKEFEPIHDYLKNILYLSGFDNYSALTNINIDTIQEIENFVRNEMFQFIPVNSNLMNYFYIYANNRSAFKIPNGHKFLLIGLKNFLTSCGLNYFKTKFQMNNNDKMIGYSESIQENLNITNQIIENNYNEPETIISRPLIVDTQSSSQIHTQGEETEIQSRENNNISSRKFETIGETRLVRNCTKNIKYNESEPSPELKSSDLPMLNDFEIIQKLIKNYVRNNYNIDVESVSVNVSKTSSNSVSGIVICPFCSSNIRIYTDRLKRRGNRWIISNFVTHFKSQHAMSCDLFSTQQIKVNNNRKSNVILNGVIKKDKSIIYD